MALMHHDGTILVAGGGGFIGGHLVRRLLAEGNTVRAVDVKPFDQWHQLHLAAENIQLDLGEKANCHAAVQGTRYVYNLAADMGGMGFIANNKALCMLSVLINTHLLLAAREAGTARYFYASSACVYNARKQSDPVDPALREEDAYPALPEDGYGWEKLFSERMCRHFHEDFGLETRVARYHNVYGPYGTWHGGREKAPAAICRKVLEALLTGTTGVEIWGDGLQTRSFMYIDDCIEGTLRLMGSNITEPINIGSSELVSIRQLGDIVAALAGARLDYHYDVSAPQGVRGRNSDNRRIRELLGWEPQIPLESGLRQLMTWISAELRAAEVQMYAS